MREHNPGENPKPKSSFGEQLLKYREYGGYLMALVAFAGISLIISNTKSDYESQVKKWMADHPGVVLDLGLNPQGSSEVISREVPGPFGIQFRGEIEPDTGVDVSIGLRGASGTKSSAAVCGLITTGPNSYDLIVNAGSGFTIEADVTEAQRNIHAYKLTATSSRLVPMTGNVWLVPRDTTLPKVNYHMLCTGRDKNGQFIVAKYQEERRETTPSRK